MKKTIRTIKFRRKRENKTNYYKRLELLKSGKSRIVIRMFSNSLLIQLVKFEPKGDKILLTVSSKDLRSSGWKHSLNNLPACYLTGLLFSKKAMENNLKEGIIDFGFNSPIPGSRSYAVVKGIVDGGMNVPVGEGVYPSDERISGEHISSYRKTSIVDDFNKLKDKLSK